MDIPASICIIVLLLGLFLPVGFLIALSMALASFGSLAIVPTELTGGTSLVASTVGPLFVVLKVFISRGGPSGVLTASFDSRRLGLLAMFTLVAVIGAFILPEVFRGSIDVYPMRTTHLISTPEAVAPTTANFTQTAYLVFSFLVSCSYSWLVSRREFADDFSRALLIGAATAAVTGLLEFITSRLGMGEVLSVFRTASYAFITGAEVQGVKRTIGLMPEASAYGGLAAFYFALLLFTRNAYVASVRWKLVLPLMGVCGAFAVLSTSSASYAELGVTIALFMLDRVRVLLFGKAVEQSQAFSELLAVVVIIAILFTVALFFDETRDTLSAIFDQMVLQKTQSASYIERSSWTHVAFEAWLTTAGLGVGVGSVRTSNFFVNILASTGFLGFGLFVAFLFKVFASQPPEADWRLSELTRGSKLTLAPSLVGAWLAGTTPDYGATAAALFGVIVGATVFNRSKLQVLLVRRAGLV